MQKENIWFQDFQVLVNETQNEACMVLEHWHDCWEMLYLEKGSVTQICDTGIMRFSAGDIILIAPKTIHSTFSGKEGSRIIVVQFDDNQWPGAIEQGYPKERNQYFAETDRLFRQLEMEFRMRKDGFLNMSHGALLQIFAYLTRLKAVPLQRKENYFKTKHIFNYIDGHIGENLSLEQAARDLGYSPQHLTVIIKEYSGYSFKPYLDYAKIMAAVRMLKFDKLPVSAVSEKLGYTDVTAFSRAFKRVIGISPRACRLL